MKKAQTIAKKTLASTTVASLVMSAMVAVPTMAAGVTTTAAPDYVGAGRVETAIKIAEGSWKDATWSASKTAVIVAQDDENLVDGLAVAPLAYKSKAPILLSVKGDKISAETMAVLKAHGVTKVYIATGAGNITDKAIDQLKGAGVTTVTRLAGSDRYETAKAIAKELNSASKEVVVVNGEAMADAMSIASIAATKEMPIYLSKDKTVPAGLEGKTIYAVGGQALAAGATKTFAGKDRLETNAAVLDGFKADLKYDTTYLAEGSDGHLVDALTGSVLAAQTKSPIVLTGAALTTTQATALKAGVTKDTQVVPFGGAVSASVKTEVQNIVVNSVAVVSAVSATTANTLTVTGTGLGRLTKEAIVISGNTVTSVVANADGTSATVTLEGKLAPDSKTTVKITDNNGAKDYIVTYGFVISKVEVNASTFDDDRAGQKLTFKVNGSSVDSDVDYLTLAGYSVNFVATDKNGAAATIFVGGVATSTDGKLKAGIDKGEYKIQLQVTKAGAALVSDTATIKVANLDANATTIDSVVFSNLAGGDNTTYDNGDLKTVDDVKVKNFLMNSTTLVAGEKTEVYSVKATINGEKKLVAEGAFEVKTSNPAVVSVAETSLGAGLGSSYAITAESAGTATITVKVGENTKTFDFTVKNEKRTLTSMKLSDSSVKVVKGGVGADVVVETFDQYGDPIETSKAVVGPPAVNDIAEVMPTVPAGSLVGSIDVDTTLAAGGASKVGKGYINVAGANLGTGTIYLKDNFTNPNTGIKSGITLASLNVEVSEVANVGSMKLELVPTPGQSTDNTLELTADKIVSYTLAKYNTNGVYVGDQVVDLLANAGTGKVTVESVNPAVAAVAVVDPAGGASTTRIDITGKAKGTTDILVKNDKSQVIAKTTITVTASPYVITGVTFKAPLTINYAGKVLGLSDVLDVVVSDKDDIVNGITLSKATESKVRIVETAIPTKVAVDDLYLDLDNNGTFTAGDVRLGAIAAFAGSDASSTLTAKVNATGAGYTITAGNGLVKATAFQATPETGTVLVKVMRDASDATTSVAATAITYSVK